MIRRYATTISNASVRVANRIEENPRSELLSETFNSSESVVVSSSTSMVFSWVTSSCAIKGVENTPKMSSMAMMSFFIGIW